MVEEYESIIDFYLNEEKDCKSAEVLNELIDFYLQQ